MRRHLLGFIRAKRGLASLEFALILPAFAAVLIGAIAAIDIARADRRVSATAATLSDLTTRMWQIDDALLTDLYDTADVLMAQFDDRMAFGIVITSVITEDDELTVSWSQANAHGVPLTDALVRQMTLPTVPVGESIIVVEVSGDYEPLVPLHGVDPLNLSAIATRRPRFVSEVVYVSGG